MSTHPGTIDFDQVGIGTALLRNRLVVPLNQREYSWEDSHVQDLFHDLANAVDSRKSSYFLGTIVLTRGKDGSWEVADGQQRLATTTILLAAIRDYFQERRDDLLVSSLNEFLYTIVRETRERKPRLQLNVDDNEFFIRRVLFERNSPERRGATPQRPSHARIDRAANLAAEHVQNIVRPLADPNKIQHLNRWVQFVEESALTILLKVPDDLNAYVMFETLNDRGLRTSQSDLVKNSLFALVDNRLAEAQQKWAAMNAALESLEGEDLTVTYLRHLLITQFGLTREREVFERVKEKVSAKQQAIEFLDVLANSAQDYMAILTPTHSKWNGYNNSIREHIRTLSFLQLIPLRPLMLAVATNFSKRHAERAFRQFVFWSVRFLVAGGARSWLVEEAIAKAAQEVSGRRVATAEQLAEQLQPVLPTDPEFEAAFTTFSVAKSAFARYYLRALELKKQNNPEPEWIPNETSVITLEHVLPLSPHDGWPHFDKASAAVYSKRLGNLVLLTVTPNGVIGNKPFSDKRQTLAGSKFLLTKEVGTESQWGAAEIEARQQRLAHIAVQTWPLRA